MADQGNRIDQTVKAEVSTKKGRVIKPTLKAMENGKVIGLGLEFKNANSHSLLPHSNPFFQRFCIRLFSCKTVPSFLILSFKFSLIFVRIFYVIFTLWMIQRRKLAIGKIRVHPKSTLQAWQPNLLLQCSPSNCILVMEVLTYITYMITIFYLLTEDL